MKRRIGAIVALIAVGSLIFWQPATSQEDNAPDLERRIDRTVREYGVVESARTVSILNEIPGDMTILSVVPEGTQVKKGDLLLSLDDSRLRDLETQAELEANAALLAVQRAGQDLEASRKASQQLTDLNALKVKAAQLNQTRYLSNGGMFDASLRSAQRDSTLAEARLKAVTNQITRRRQSGQAVSAEELELLDLDAQKARDEAAEAQEQIQLLTNYERPYQTVLLELAVSQAKAEQIQQQTQTQTAILQASTLLEGARLERTQAEAKLERVKDQLAKCRILAPMDGVVLYAASNRRSSAGEGIKAGASVAEGQPILTIADLDDLQVRARVHESRIHRVKEGQSVRMKMDAFPQKTYEGKVLSVSQVPEPAGFFESGVKTYVVFISLDGSTENLRLGLSTMVEIDAPD